MLGQRGDSELAPGNGPLGKKRKAPNKDAIAERVARFLKRDRAPSDVVPHNTRGGKAVSLNAGFFQLQRLCSRAGEVRLKGKEAKKVTG